MSKLKLKITINGEIFTRTTDRVYTHVLVGRRDEQKARTKAYLWTAEDEKYFQQHFAHQSALADGTWFTRDGDPIPTDPNDYFYKVRQQAIADVAKGIDAFRTEEQASRAARFEKDVAAGHYRLAVISWHGSLKNAQSALRTVNNRGWTVDLQIIPVGGTV